MNVLKRLANVEISVADCERRKGPGAPGVGVGINKLRISDKSDMVGSRCSRLNILSASICPLVLGGSDLGYPAFPVAPGATFDAAPEDNLFAPPKHHPPNYDQGKWYNE